MLEEIWQEGDKEQEQAASRATAQSLCEWTESGI